MSRWKKIVREANRYFESPMFLTRAVTVVFRIEEDFDEADGWMAETAKLVLVVCFPALRNRPAA